MYFPVHFVIVLLKSIIKLSHFCTNNESINKVIYMLPFIHEIQYFKRREQLSNFIECFKGALSVPREFLAT